MGLFGGKKKRVSRGQGGSRSKRKAPSSAPANSAQAEKQQELALGEAYKASEISFTELIIRLGAFFEFSGNALDEAVPLVYQGFDELAVAETVLALEGIFNISYELPDEELYTMTVNELKQRFQQ